MVWKLEEVTVLVPVENRWFVLLLLISLLLENKLRGGYAVLLEEPGSETTECKSVILFDFEAIGVREWDILLCDLPIALALLN